MALPTRRRTRRRSHVPIDDFLREAVAAYQAVNVRRGRRRVWNVQELFAAGPVVHPPSCPQDVERCQEEWNRLRNRDRWETTDVFSFSSSSGEPARLGVLLVNSYSWVEVAGITSGGILWPSDGPRRQTTVASSSTEAAIVAARWATAQVSVPRLHCPFNQGVSFSRPPGGMIMRVVHLDGRVTYRYLVSRHSDTPGQHNSVVERRVATGVTSLQDNNVADRCILHAMSISRSSSLLGVAEGHGASTRVVPTLRSDGELHSV